jgi:IS5 family transposase
MPKCTIDGREIEFTAGQNLIEVAKKGGIKLRQSFLRLAQRARREVGRLLNTGGHAQGLRHLRKLRTFAGRLWRDITRKAGARAERAIHG